MGIPALLEATELDTIIEECFTDTYIKNTKMVAGYQSNTIQEVFKKRNIQTLRALRKQLAVLVCDSNPEHVLESLIVNAKREDIIKQIVSLTLKIGKPSPHAEDLSEVFRVIKTPISQLEELNMSDPEVVRRTFIAMFSEINDLKSKLDQVKCESCRDPDSLNQTQTEESVDQTHEVEEESPESPQDPEQALQREVEPLYVMGAEPKTIRVFVGNVNKSITREQLQDYSLKQKKVKIRLEDIHNEAARTDGKSYSVRVPVDQLKQFTANWPEGMKVERFVSKTKNSASNPPRRYEGNRQVSREQNFYRPPQNNHRPNPRNQGRNNPSGDRTQKFRPTPRNDHNSQNRDHWRRDTPKQDERYSRKY